MVVLTSQGWGLSVCLAAKYSIHEGEAGFLGLCCRRDSRGRQCVYLSIVPSAGEFPVCMGALFYLFSPKKEQVTTCPFISTSALKYRHLLPISFEFVRKTLLLLVWLCLQTEAH